MKVIVEMLAHVGIIDSAEEFISIEPAPFASTSRYIDVGVVLTKTEKGRAAFEGRLQVNTVTGESRILPLSPLDKFPVDREDKK